MATDTASAGFAHMVYFTLKDSAPAAQRRLIEACQEFLSGHPGTQYFSVGTRADTQRDVIDRDYHVALLLVFSSRQAHDAYQAAPRHEEFIAQERDNWARVRVFDADLAR